MKSKINFILGMSNLILWMTNLATWIVLPAYFTLNISLFVFCICMSILLLYQKKQAIINLAKSEQFKHLTNSIVSVGLMIGIMGLVNYLTFKNSVQWDLTEKQMNSLSNETLKVVKNIEDDLSIKAFFRRKERLKVTNLLELYKMSHSKIKVTHFDPDLEPAMVREFGIKGTGSIVLQYKEKTIVIHKADEYGLSSAILRLTRSKKPKLYFASGQGERSLTRDSEVDVTDFAKKLKENYYAVEELNMLGASKIPEDASTLFILSPSREYSDAQISLIKNYLENGGNLFIGLNLNLKQDSNTNLTRLIADYGVIVHNSLIIDSKNHVNGSKGWAPIAATYNVNHEITKDFADPLFFPLAMGLEVNGAKKREFLIEKLAETSAYPYSWLEKNIDQVTNGTAAFDANIDKAGPWALAISIKRKLGEGRIIVVSNGTLLNNMYEGQGGNFTFGLKATSWLLKENALVSITKNNYEQKLTMISAPQLKLTFFFAVLFLPLTFIGLASFTFIKKRKTV